jgi:deoxyhypusine synthase
MSKGPISQFIEKHYLHFNSAALVDAAKGYEEQLANGAKMMVTCWSNEYCRNRKDFCRNDSSRQSSNYILYWCKFRRYHEFGSHSHYERVPNYRDLTQNKNGIYLKEG